MKTIEEAGVLITEQCGSLGRIAKYWKQDGQASLTRSCAEESLTDSITETVKETLRDVFLPHGYPESVSEDYLAYQVWDTVQAFCSTITGTLTTRAVLRGVGVGDASATPLAAAITWVAKDGTGMVGRILFTWWKGNDLDGDCKKWRLFADIVNDTAMFFELLVPFATDFSLHVLCITTAMKAIVGVAGNATRASITQHQAIKGNMADVSAKDGSQETCVNLLASIVGVFMLALFNEGPQEWYIFFLLTAVHLIANYLAVKSLIFTHLNNVRLAIVSSTYIHYDAVPTPYKVNKKEPVILGFNLQFRLICGMDIKVGHCLQKVLLSQSPERLQQLTKFYLDKKYFIIPDLNNRTIHVALLKGETSADVISAYFNAILLGLIIWIHNGIYSPIHIKHQTEQHTFLMRLKSWVNLYAKMEPDEDFPLNISSFEEFKEQEINMFFGAFKVEGWNVNTHALEVGKWRYEWNPKCVAVNKYDVTSIPQKKNE